MRLAQVTNRVADLSERYEVPEKLGRVTEKVYDGMSAASEAARAASEAARKGAMVAYRAALEHPKTSIGGIILAAALVGGALWYVFGNWRQPAARKRSHGTRVRAGGNERRKRGRAARAAAA
ncbi:MAG TPA: hypothetical protein VGX52_12740 [Burkholderiales bacterium]|nr:hypothetical protein [Burkholderiales bacterium]